MTDSDKKRIILVEDDLNLGFLLVDFLDSNNFDVKLYRDGEAGLKGFQMNHFDFCILDIMLPQMDGFTLLQKIKEINKNVPVMLLSARSLKEDKIKGFNLGIDDYLTKPFDEEELLCRIQAIINRTIPLPEGKKENRTILIGEYEFDPSNQVLRYFDISHRLTIKESNILEMLCSSKNEIVKREELMVKIWGDSDYYTGRSLDVFISKIRRYLKDDASIKIITIPTVGYILEGIES